VRANAAKFNPFQFGRERKIWLTAATFTNSNLGGAEKIASHFPANREINREFCKFEPASGFGAPI